MLCVQCLIFATSAILRHAMATEDVTSITRGTEWVSLEESVAAGMEKRTEVFVDYDTWYWQLPEQLTAAIRSGVQQGMRKFCYSCASENGRLGTHVQEDGTPTNWSRYELCLEAMTQRNLDNGTIRKVRIVMHDVEPSDVLPPGGEIQIKVHYGSNWWRIPPRMLQVSIEDFTSGAEEFFYQYNNGTDYMVNVASKIQTNLSTSERREIKSACILTHRATDH